ncbi:MAG: hypothetical protein EZS28_021896 [Streblomastix strix]|uniref:Transmembrane protein n=1 Tax=Streblomastix strix TaxID=222440 RepID=A0A5J4VIZ9_9EUKA|nr:MAG: hypothetical protein EZS28_021896 [Streblomastix strix]
MNLMNLKEKLILMDTETGFMIQMIQSLFVYPLKMEIIMIDQSLLMSEVELWLFVVSDRRLISFVIVVYCLVVNFDVISCVVEEDYIVSFYIAGGGGDDEYVQVLLEQFVIIVVIVIVIKIDMALIIVMFIIEKLKVVIVLVVV